MYWEKGERDRQKDDANARDNKICLRPAGNSLLLECDAVGKELGCEGWSEKC